LKTFHKEAAMTDDNKPHENAEAAKRSRTANARIWAVLKTS